jgi:predicted transcriptional regulator
MRRNIWWLIAGSRGGENRARIIESLHDEPQNTHQLSENLELDYKTVKYHLNLLIQNKVIVAEGPAYGKIYFISELFETEFEEFVIFWNDRRKNSHLIPSSGKIQKNGFNVTGLQ